MSRRPFAKLSAPGESGARARLYSRVSSEEQVDGYSLDAKLRAAEGFCQARGWTLEREYREEGKSAWTDDVTARPNFARMLADAEAGQFSILIVHRLDRLARNVRVTLEVLQRLDAAGVSFVSINENMDFTTPIGRVVLTTLAAFAEYSSANLSAETRKGNAERKARGRYNGLLPFGVIRGSDGVPVLDREARWCHIATRSEVVPAEGLHLAFDLAAAGHTD